MKTILALIAGTIVAVILQYFSEFLLPKNKTWKTLLVIILVLLAAIGTYSFATTTSQNNDPSLKDCQFVDEIIQKTTIIEWIDTPIGSENWSGLQVITATTITIPEGWIVHYDNSDDRLGPLTVPKNTIASIYAPYKCRPLNRD